MTESETARILATFRAAYPAFYRGMTKEDLSLVTKLWQKMFAEESYWTVAAAAELLICTKTDSYPPSIGAVKEHIRELSAPAPTGEQAAWALVMKAASRGIYHSREEFDALPEDVRAAVGTADQLHSWALMDSEELQTVVASNFMRTYRQIAKRTALLQALPEQRKAELKIENEQKLIGGKER